jgi:hypothetical protein
MNQPLLQAELVALVAGVAKKPVHPIIIVLISVKIDS